MGTISSLPSILPSLPTSDKNLRCHVNLNGYALANPPYWQGYPIEQWINDRLVVDLEVSRQETGFEPFYGKMVQNYYICNKKATVGTYISGSDTRKPEHRKSFPTEAVDYYHLPSLFYSTPYDDKEQRATVDITKAKAARLFSDQITTLLINRKRSLCYLDNIRHPMMLPTAPPWQTTTNFLSGITQKLHDNNMLVMCNIAVAPQYLSDTEIDQIGNAVDGFTFEQSFHDATVLSDKEMFLRSIYVYRKWLDNDKTVVFIPVMPAGSLQNPTIEDRENYCKFQAALAMIIRQPGHHLFVTGYYWRPLPEWYNWPEQFGKPISDYELDYPIMRRKFTMGTIEVNIKTKEVSAAMF